MEIKLVHVFRSKRKDGTPSPKWRYQYTDHLGNRVTRTGTKDKRETERLALQEEAEHEAIRRGLKPPPGEEWTPVPFNQAAREYLDWGNDQGGRGGRPWSSIHARMRRNQLRWWRDKLRPTQMDDLNGCLAKVERLLRGLRRDGRSSKTLTSYADTLHAFCTWARERGYLEKDPLEGLAPFDTTPQEQRRAMTENEIGRLLEHCDPKRRLCYQVALASGLRANELRSLTVADLDVERSGLRLQAAWTKARLPGFQPLARSVVALLEKEANGRELDEPLLYVPTHTGRDLEKDLERAGISKRAPGGKLDFHSLRVTYISRIIESGASVKEAQTLARHATPEMTMNVYARVREERLAAVAEGLGAMVGGTTPTVQGQTA